MTLLDSSENPTQAQMCFQVHKHLENIIECLAGLQDQSLLPDERKSLLDFAEKESKVALQLCAILFQSTTTADFQTSSSRTLKSE